MDNKQKLHQIKLSQWAARFQEQAASGLTVKQWCTENNITIHTYNYRKHKLKLEYLDACLPAEHDIVPLSQEMLQAATSTDLHSPPVISKSYRQLHESCNSPDLHEQRTFSVFSLPVSFVLCTALKSFSDYGQAVGKRQRQAG